MDRDCGGGKLGMQGADEECREQSQAEVTNLL